MQLDLFAPRAEILFVRHRWARRYILRVLDDGTLRVTLPRWGSRREALAFLERSTPWIAKQQQQVQARPALARAHDITVTRVSVRNQRSRWGACSARGSITLNWRLILVPDCVREYVM